MPIIFFILVALMSGLSFARPAAYTELLDYVIPSPDQGETNTCLFMASTGAMEIIANKKYNMRNPGSLSHFDLAESFVINAPNWQNASFFEAPVLRFNTGYAVHYRDWPFAAWNGPNVNHGVWRPHPNMASLPKVQLPQVETIRLFQFGNRWSTRVLNSSHVEIIKEALWKYKSPILVNYNDENYWHVILIIGYDDHLPGECYDTDPAECAGDEGSFYIRDSFGVAIEVRDYDWFRVKGNAAFVVKAKD